MSRNFDQIIRSRETDSWSNSIDISTGTASVVGTVSPHDQFYITDIAASAAAAGKLSIFNGTAFLFQLGMIANTTFDKTFGTPLKGSYGTSIEGRLEGANGNMKINLSGYRKG